MAVLPTDGGSEGVWCALYNAYLLVEHNADGTHDIGSLISFSAMSVVDSEDNTLIKAHAYLAGSDGFVVAHGRGASNQFLNLYIGDSDDPAGAGTLVSQADSQDSNGKINVSFSVASGEYFEITSDMSLEGPAIIWRSVGTLSKPVDQD